MGKPAMEDQEKELERKLERALDALVGSAAAQFQ
jgi:hypothetical protein